ncbi:MULTISPECIES: hypothetical protein [unclassified Gilliamella]|uniref:hypothetical protein n=1 Tax=unclassified Gilliamella TaxID=2685620 RepID=UPI00130AC8B0|nr:MULTISPECIES: hypothetical protein [unclassified Gilliamella]MWP48444.1 hypothetical protein [Gilliamella sp. Lep-s35]MWP68277.1 hypothetical protein [Gilliamella sp. Lep-s5]MWP76584.1 hypothetical protein [Gilliamella sp. Lep-s21]
MANISLDAINTINTKLGQANTITTLLMVDCDSDMPINDELRAYALDAVSDLINDSKKLFRSETERKEAKNERV